MSRHTSRADHLPGPGFTWNLPTPTAGTAQSITLTDAANGPLMP
ncbi:hypothetical protein ACWCSD_12545 [Nonomuraea sp. NPDC001684]